MKRAAWLAIYRRSERPRRGYGDNALNTSAGRRALGFRPRGLGRKARWALCDLFEALGDELIYALASLGGLFGYASMKLRGNAQ